MKKIKCWVEIYSKRTSKFDAPCLWMKKPSPRELKNNLDFDYKTYEATILIGKELKIK